MITVNMLQAKKVVFLKPLFEDDFAERGMTAWLTKIEWNPKVDCYELFFDFTEFEAENDKYLTRVYHPNRHTSVIDPNKNHRFYTAKEAGVYTNKTASYCSPMKNGKCVDSRDDEAFAETIKEFLLEV